MNNQAKGIAYAGITAVCWGFLAIGLKIADRKIDPITVVWVRFVFAFLMLAAWQLAFNPKSFRIMSKPPFILIVATLGLMWNYVGFMFGIHYTTPGNAQLFIQFGPILLATAGFLFFKEHLVRRQLLGYAIAFAGFAFFYSDQLHAFFENHADYNLGIGIILSSAIAWAIYAILQKKLVEKYSVDSLNLFLFGVPALLFTPMANPESLLKLNFAWWLLMFFLGANTFIAYTFMAKALKYTDANKVSIIIILNPIITFVVMGALTYSKVTWITAERFSIYTVAGILLVITGALLVIRKNKQP